MVRKVLFVDDDQILQRAVEKQLEAYNSQFNLIFANDGFDAVKKLQKFSVSLICMDLVMPRMDGPSLLAHVREKYPDIPVIIISEMSSDAVEHLVNAEGVVGYFKKPFQADELGNKILALLREEAKGGIMNNVSPTMFMQLLEMEGKTSTIRLLDNNSAEGGILYLLDGQLLDTRVGNLTGMEGAYKVFSWDEITVFFRNECEPRENRIKSELQSIIMGALAAKDELDDSSFGDEEGSPVAADPIAGGNLEDLGLPPDILETTPSQANPGTDHAAMSGHNVDKLTEILQDELSDKDGIDAIYYDKNLAAVTRKIEDLGTITAFGSLKAAHVKSEDGKDRIVVHGEPPAVLDVGAGFTIDRILRLL